MIKKDKKGYKVVSEKGKNLGSGYKTGAAACPAAHFHFNREYIAPFAASLWFAHVNTSRCGGLLSTSHLLAGTPRTQAAMSSTTSCST